MKYRTSNEASHKAGKSFHLLFIGFISFVMLGSILYVLYPTYPIWQDLIFTQGMSVALEEFSMPHLMLSLCVIPIIWMLVIAISGTSMIGAPITCGLFILRASALGSVLTQLYVCQGIGGIGTAMLFVMPYALVSSVLYILGIREAMRFSLNILRLVWKNECNSMSLRLYAMRFLAMLLMMVLAGVLQCILIRFGYSDYME